MPAMTISEYAERIQGSEMSGVGLLSNPSSLALSINCDSLATCTWLMPESEGAISIAGFALQYASLIPHK